MCKTCPHDDKLKRYDSLLKFYDKTAICDSRKITATLRQKSGASPFKTIRQMMHNFFNIIPGEDACCILLYGDIGDSCGTVSSGQIAHELLAAEAAYKNIDVRINSNGGEVYAGIAIFNALRNSRADIRIYIDGIAASMASVIALCGKPVQMSKYARLMLHSVSGACYGNKNELKSVLKEIESLEDTLCQMYAAKLGKSADNIKSAYFDGKEHWLTADEALRLGFIDGIYDADPVPDDATAEQIYTIFNNRIKKPKNELSMNIEDLKRYPQFKGCTTEDDIMKRIDSLAARAALSDSLESENAELKAKVSAHEEADEAVASAERKTLLDAAERDGRITAETRPVYESLLKEHPEDGKKALAAISPRKRVVDDLVRGGSGNESPWEIRQREIRDNLKH
jgi:ATP-dependent Clp endopeptidase proteolytic subunit ClpP